ncbi:MAG: 4-hydroxy-tetrahydrodipicolinate reductase [Alphaproteobacteria bacterium]|nr:4-hydroxy-tetrahydrodipicolinate reductase [Alphaproteobacteria bacterium]
MSRPVAVVVSGAAGRMGQAVIEAIAAEPRTRLHAALEREGSPALGQVVQGDIAITADGLQALLHADALIDFSTPASTVALAGLAAQARVTHVIGTTGLSEDDQKRIVAASRHAPIIQSGNFSLGVNLLASLVRKAAETLGPAFDIEIVEMHHRHKVDAPSGTALLLGRAAAAGRNRPLEELRTPPRDGHTGPRPEGSIGMASLRGGSVVGDHTVTFAADHERIELTHRAESRGIFARGAIAAALWGQGKNPGLYAMQDVLGL